MEIISDIQELRGYIRNIKSSNRSLGFVPTMGALHDGHIELIRHSVRQNEITACSIFVNPTQFNSGSDLKNYPRETDSDLEKLDAANCDIVFMPAVEDMYEKHILLNLDFGYLEEIMEGKFRPGHFKGVGLVVAKLFNLVNPDRAYFGRKDLQQLVLIKTLTRELRFDIEIIAVDTVREKDGLAMSSRNQLLSMEDRENAHDLHESLVEARKKLKEGETIPDVKKYIKNHFKSMSKIDLEYFEIVDAYDLKNVDEISQGTNIALCVAGYLGKVRLIDNILLN